MSHRRAPGERMVAADPRRLAAACPQLLAELRDAHGRLEAEPRGLREGERLRTLAERGVRVQDPAAADVVLARDDDLVDVAHVERLELLDGERADVVEIPAGREAEDGGPFVWGARFPGAELPGSPIPQDHG